MQPVERSARSILWFRRGAIAALVLALPLTLAQSRWQLHKAGDEKKKDEAPKASSEVKGGTKTSRERAAKPVAGAVEVQFIDDSTMKLTLRDERIELITPYGKLLIPVGDIERIEVAFRIPDEIAKRIETNLADLGSGDFSRREAASVELRELGARAYPALLKAEKSRDAEVVRRVRELLEKIRVEVSAERLEFRTHDAIYTEDSKFTGRIAPAALKVGTFQFGEQQLKLSDVRELYSSASKEAVNALPDPGNLATYMGQVGKVFAFRVTGAVQGQGGAPVIRGLGGPGGMVGQIVFQQGGVWGTDVYTLDSNLALAAIHAGAVRSGQTRVVRVKILGAQQGFQPSTRHGITSMAFGFYNGGFQFVRARPER